MEEALMKFVENRLATLQSEIAQLQIQSEEIKMTIREKKIAVQELKGVVSASSSVNGTLTVKGPREKTARAGTKKEKLVEPVEPVCSEDRVHPIRFAARKETIPQRIEIFLKDCAPRKFTNKELFAEMAERWPEYKKKESFEGQVANTTGRFQKANKRWLGSEQNEKRVWRYWYKGEI